MKSETGRHYRSAAAALTVIGLLLAVLGVFSSSAGAVEFESGPKPTVTSSQECDPTAGGLAVTIVMANEGDGNADFDYLVRFRKDGVDVGGVSMHLTAVTSVYSKWYPVPEGQSATFRVKSTAGSGVDFTLEVPVVDCQAHPMGSIAVICPSTPAEGPVLAYTYQNDSQFPVDFTFAGADQPDAVKTGVKNMAAPATETRAVYEDHAAHGSIYADGVLLDTLDTLDTTIDCAPPNHIVVSKTVVGGTGNPAFPFEVVCRPDFDTPTTVIDTFSLHNGESKSVDLPYAYSYCYAREIDPGAAWTVTALFNGSPVSDPFGENFFPNDMNYTLAVTNTAVIVPIPVIPTVPDSTIPDSTVPVTTIPDTTIPDTTIPSTTIPVTATTPVPVTAEPAPQVSPAAVVPTTLARTGSNTEIPLVTGLVSFVVGFALVGASRLYRRRTA
ncbi:MAG: hypothetical protein ABIP03_12425 [Aquihabitans sp.]